MTDLLPIVADAPCAEPRLGFEAYAAALAAAIRGGTPAQFTVGIYGAWGSGKSSLLNAIGAELAKDRGVIAVSFDAWRYERAPHIVVPLLHRIETAMRQVDDPRLRDRVRKALVSVVRSLSITAGPVSLDASELVGDGRDVEPLDAAFERPYEDMRAISEALGDRRIVVLIDDLDRCSPANVVAVLEAINLVMDVRGFVFVLALDYEVLVAAVTAKYPHASGHVFIEKMVQVPFRVPRLRLDQDAFLGDLVPEWSARIARLPGGFGALAYDVATLGLAGNPRQIKRFVNTVLVLHRVAVERAVDVDVRVLAAVVGLQLRWPAEYQDFADAVLAGDESPVAGLREGDDADLVRYVGRLFTESESIEVLQATLLLAQAAGAPEDETGYQTGEYDSSTESGSTPRERNLSVIRAELERNGFRQRGTSQAYYHEAIPGVRAVIGKTVVRFEAKERASGRWLLAFSSSIARGRDEIVAFLRDPPQLAEDVRATLERMPPAGSYYDVSQFR